MTTRYRDRSRARNETASDWRVESRTNGRNFGGPEGYGTSYGGAKITGCLATRPFSVIDILYTYQPRRGRGRPTLPSVLDEMTPRITVQLPFNFSDAVRPRI